MKRILLASSLLLFSCQKEKVVCDCHELIYKRNMSILNPEYIFVGETETFRDICAYDGNVRVEEDTKWVKVCN